MVHPPPAPALICEVYDLGLCPYPQAWELQKALVELHRRQPQPDRLLLLEHPPVYTLGQGATLENLKFSESSPPWPLFRIERGGEVTHHCPGQLVGYPILDLKRHQTDLHWYLRQLEEVIILTLAKLGLGAQREAGLTGVWVGDYKLAAIGIKVSRWVTMHGFALNVCPDLQGFQAIVPCGIAHRPVGCLTQFCPGITVAEVLPLLIEAFAQVFQRQIVLGVDGPWVGQTGGPHKHCTETSGSVRRPGRGSDRLGTELDGSPTAEPS
ncbi:MAG TPA: lipoyl(octanoyl) transferase LipB [Leptolyngbyaceae cyanobacterium M65_K2018_010]|nr:lipoyl(octanoyl) transferase LipB [Leptolyngbyaceae cyanobacterium M65_K2018_010]